MTMFDLDTDTCLCIVQILLNVVQKTENVIRIQDQFTVITAHSLTCINFDFQLKRSTNR